MKNAILVGIGTKTSNLEESMLELENLAQANNIETSKVMVQMLEKRNIATYVGKGKVEEIHEELLKDETINYVITNDELMPSQIRNLNKVFGDEIKVIDRTMLILDIFKTRAKTKEAIIQVKIARLHNKLSHLVLTDENYDQQRGGASTANRGSGEKKIDIDRRTIRHKIHELNAELLVIAQEHKEQGKQRKKNEKFIVSLIGYTNAGKSTLLNHLIQEDVTKKVFEKDMLFATLDTSIRKLYLNNKREILVSDTIGFIDKLPTKLISSFKSTLQEATDADLLLHVVDYSNPNYLKHIEVTNETLKSIGVKDYKMLYIYNKSDLIDDSEYPILKDDNLYISAKEESSIELLKNTIQNILYPDMSIKTLKIPYNEYKLVDTLIKNNVVTKIENQSDYVEIEVELSTNEIERYNKYLS